jgi:PAS domain S-box-containing protein
VVVVDGDDGLARELSPFETLVVTERPAVRAALSETPDCVVVTDGTTVPVADVLATVRDIAPDVPAIAAPYDGSEQAATDALGAGADDYVPASRSETLRGRVGDAVGERSAEAGLGAGRTPVPLESIAGSLSEVLVTIDADSTVRYINDAVADVFGYERSAVEGESLTMLMPDRFHDAHHDGVARYLAAGERALDWSSIELPGQHADGHEIELEVSFGEFTDGGERYFTGLIRDVTAEADREAALSELYEASQRLLLATTPAEIAQVTVETATEALSLPISGVYRESDDGERLGPLATSEGARDLFGDPVPVLSAGDSLAWETYRDGETRVIDDVHDRPGAHNPETPIRTELQVPIGGRWLLVSGSTDDRTFEDYQIDFAELLAAATEAAFQRADRDAELKRYETIVRSIDERVCVIDSEFTVQMANEALCSFVGRDRSELLGASVGSFLESRVDTTALSAADPGESITVEVDVVTADGTVPCEVDLTALPPGAQLEGFVAAVHDISDRRAVEQSLAAQRDRFARLFENIPDPVVEARIVDGTPVVESVNAAFEDVFGYDEATVVGEDLNEFVLPPDGDARASLLDRRAEDGSLVEAELRRETAKGIRDFLFRGIPVETSGDAGTLAFGIYTDITDQRLRERRLGVLNRVFRHNIRNDMSVVLGRARHLVETGTDEERRAHAETIESTAEKVVDLAEGIRIAEQALEREEQLVRPLAAVVDDGVADYRNREDVALSVAVGETAACVDERIAVAIDQLVENAVEHTDRERPTVAVRAERTDAGLRVSVADDGPGIPENERSVIDRQAETPLEHGVGVGLWLVTWVTTSVGGDLSITDNDPRGTVVTLTFPESALADPEP